MPNRRPAALLALLVLAAGACAAPFGGRAPAQAPSRAASPTLTASPTNSSPAAGQGSVFVIVLENRDYEQAVASPYVSALAREYAILTNYRAVSHPSLPNYLALTSGSTWGITDSDYHALPQSGLGDQLSAARVSWKAYMEGFTGDCFQSPYPYALRHNPFAYYGGRCPANVVPMSELAADLAATPPRLAWLTPGLCSDGHDCDSSSVDAWLRSVVPAIVASASWRSGGLLLVTYDEDAGGSDNRVPTLVIAPNLRSHSSDARYDHYSLLATVEDRLGVGRLGAARTATAITGLF